jgi:S-(hydroxymethyl)glutathione dehydrogenase/alcohol dehydrogenase
MGVPERVLARLPDEVTFEDGALLCCILPTILRGLDVSPIQRGGSVAVMGLGQVGLTAVMAARDAGAGQIVAVDPIAPRRMLAEEFGADATIDPSMSDAVGEIKELTGGEGADLVIVAASSALHSGPGSLAATAFEAVVKLGQVTFVGLTGEQKANFNRVLSKEIRVVGAKAKMGPEYVERALALVTSRKWDLETYRRLVTHRLELKEVPAALSGQGLDGAVKVLIRCGGGDLKR